MYEATEKTTAEAIAYLAKTAGEIHGKTAEPTLTNTEAKELYFELEAVKATMFKLIEKL